MYPYGRIRSSILPGKSSGLNHIPASDTAEEANFAFVHHFSFIIKMLSVNYCLCGSQSVILDLVCHKVLASANQVADITKTNRFFAL